MIHICDFCPTTSCSHCKNALWAVRSIRISDNSLSYFQKFHTKSIKAYFAWSSFLLEGREGEGKMLKNVVAVVTGGASGLGKATVERFGISPAWTRKQERYIDSLYLKCRIDSFLVWLALDSIFNFWYLIDFFGNIK